jgi:phosphinothricin acetyltransferase
MEIYHHYVRTSTCTYQEEEDTIAERQAWFHKHSQRHPIFVITENERVVAWGALSPFHPRSAYRHTVEDSIYVRVENLGSGLGKLMLEHLLTAAAQLGHQQIIGLISSDQTASIKLHQAYGFTRVGHLPDVGIKFGTVLSLELWQLAV